MYQKKFSVILHSLYAVMIVFFLLDAFTACEIKSQIVKSFAYIGTLIFTPVVLCWNIYFLVYKKRKSVWLVLSALMLVCVFVAGPLKIIFASGAWYTKSILYQHKNYSFRQIEYQIQHADTGYNNRTVEVFYLTHFFTIISKVPDDVKQRTEWMKVGNEINRLEIKNK